jgi:hypothetical protein
MSDVTIYHLEEKEVHMLGDYVGVVWNTKRRKKQMKNEEDGLTYEAVVAVRDGAPYIDFPYIREDEHDHTFYEDEDGLIDGGISAQTATQVAGELVTAVEYLTKLKAKEKEAI